MDRNAVLFSLVALVGCGSQALEMSAISPATTEAAAPIEGSTPVVEQPPAPTTLQGHLALALHSDLRVVGHGNVGSSQWVVFDVLAIDRWLGEQDERAELQARVDAHCGAEAALPEDEREDRDCRATALHSRRRPYLRRQFLQECVVDEGGEPEDCERRFGNESVFDIGVECRELYAALIERAEDGSVSVQSRVMVDDCAGGVRGVEARDLDGDGQEELLIDHVQSEFHEMDFINAWNGRELAVVKIANEAVSTQHSAPLGFYYSDLGYFRVLCGYEVLDSPVRLSRTCCLPPDPLVTQSDDEDPEGEEEDDEVTQVDPEPINPVVSGGRWGELQATQRATCGTLRTDELSYDPATGFSDPVRLADLAYDALR